MKIYHIFIFLLFFQATAQTNFERGKKLMEQKRFDEAKPFLEKELKDTPNNYQAIDFLGEIAINEKNWDVAIASGKKLKDAFPNNANYWYKYGGAMGLKAKSVNKFKALGMIDDIENAFLTAAKLDAKHIDVRWALVQLYIELPGIIGGSEKKAQKYADELMNLSKVDGYLSKGFIDEYFDRYKKAEANYIKAHEIGNSKTTFQKLYNLYLNKIKDKSKAQQLKTNFNQSKS